MKFNLTNKTYYENHFRILERYTIVGDTLYLSGPNTGFKAQHINSYLILQNKKLSEQIPQDKKYDTLIFTDYFEAPQDIYSLLLESKNYLKPNSKIIISVVNYKYSYIIKLLEFLKLKKKSSKLSHIHENSLKNIAQATGLEFLYSHTKQIIPFKFFGIMKFLNTLFELLFSKLNFGLIRYFVFKNSVINSENKLKRTVLIPAKNEEGNISILFEKLNKLEIDEVVFSIGKSNDKTEETILENIDKYKSLNVICHNQTRNGKANSIWEGLKIVNGDLIAILDSDMSVDPIELENFFSILENNYADFVNGTRLIYPMEKESMRKINLIGNSIFQFVVSYILGVKLSDSLCGTKVFKKDFIDKIYWWQQNFQLYDPFCDFDLLFTAAITGEKIVEYPIHYKSRIYGKTQISRFKDGFKLIIYLIKSIKIFHTSN